MARAKTWWPSTRAELEALHAAAARDDRDALTKLAVLYDDGSARDARGRLLVKRDRRRAHALYARAADLGDARAITAIADRLTGPGKGPRAFARAEKLYRRALRLGNDAAAENLAAAYLNLGRFSDALRWYRYADSEGSPTASLEVARAELYGLGTRRNSRSAFARLERLSRQRLGWNNWLRIEAMLLMADALENGWLARRDFRRGEVLRRQAARLDPKDYFARR